MLAAARLELEEQATALAYAAADVELREARAQKAVEEIERRLADDSAELDSREAALDSYAATLGARSADVERREAVVEERQRELGAVELLRASVERREEALEARERAVAPSSNSIVDTSSHFLFVPGEAYSLVERSGCAPALDAPVELGQRHYVVIRLGASPLPGDARACAYLSV